MHSTTWQITLNLFEEEDHTRAEAVLRTSAGTEIRHSGVARLRPGDRDIPEIGDELAVCRALHGLAQDLLEATVVDVWANDPTGPQPRIQPS